MHPHRRRFLDLLLLPLLLFLVPRRVVVNETVALFRFQLLATYPRRIVRSKAIDHTQRRGNTGDSSPPFRRFHLRRRQPILLISSSTPFVASPAMVS